VRDVRRATWLTARAFGAALVGAIGCVPPPPAVVAAPAVAQARLRELPARPPLATVVRDGDPRAGLAVVVLTSGVDDAAGPRVPVALAAVTEARLASDGVPNVTVAPTWDGYRVRALLPTDGDATKLVHALRDALLTPIAATDVDAATRKLAILARRPLHDPALALMARCGDEPMATDHDAGPAVAATLEQWRAASDGLGRVVFGATGTAGEVDGVAASVLGQPAWPSAAPVGGQPGALPAAPPLAIYDGAPEVPTRSARVTLTLEATSPVAMKAAALLGAADGPLAARLLASEPSAVLRDVTATAHPGGGCLAVSVDVTHGDSAVAATAAILRQEAQIAVASAAASGASDPDASLEGDPRAAAELAAWWAVVDAAPSVTRETPHGTLAIGLAGSFDAPLDLAARTRDLAAAVERAEVAWQTPAVEAKTAIEPGQGSVWVLVASECGTLTEGDADAGLTGLALSALAEDAPASARADGVDVAPWVTTDGAGLLIRVPRRDGETSARLAARAADIAGEAFTIPTIGAEAVARARVALVTSVATVDARSFATLAAALTPGHPSWSFPLTPGRGFDRWSDGAVASRLSALRRDPLRVAVLGTDRAAEAVAPSVDRWIPRTGVLRRVCTPTGAPLAAKPGTYAAPASYAPGAWLAIPIPRASRDAAVDVAAALDGADGLLAHALSSGLASSWGARVIGPPDTPALAIHIAAPSQTLDGAVAQVRGLLDRLRQGAFTQEDHTRARMHLAERDVSESLDPRTRLVRLWRGDTGTPPLPSLDAVRAFLAHEVADDALLIVVSRPPRLTR
jgi:hypothetical protein